MSMTRALGPSASNPEAGRPLHVAGSDVAGDLAGMLRETGFVVDRVVLRGAARTGPERVHCRRVAERL
jgi:phosphohistidine phosphatase SixA